jgi:acylphosphatase
MSGGERARLVALAHGRVQGVGYRMFAIRRAQELGLSGYVRNLPDHRTVEVVAEGTRDTLERLLAQLRRGPHGARVDAVETTWGPAQGGLGSFDVRF